MARRALAPRPRVRHSSPTRRSSGIVLAGRPEIGRSEPLAHLPCLDIPALADDDALALLRSVTPGGDRPRWTADRALARWPSSGSGRGHFPAARGGPSRVPGPALTDTRRPSRTAAVCARLRRAARAHPRRLVLLAPTTPRPERGPAGLGLRRVSVSDLDVGPSVTGSDDPRARAPIRPPVGSRGGSRSRDATPNGAARISSSPSCRRPAASLPTRPPAPGRCQHGTRRGPASALARESAATG